MPHRKLAGPVAGLILAFQSLLFGATPPGGSVPAAGAPAAPPAAPAPDVARPALAGPAGSPAAAVPAALPAGPVNLDLAAGEVGQMPPGWEVTADSERAGFGAELTDQQPFPGRRAALIHTVVYSAVPATGTLMQRFGAGAYRGRRVRFRAAVRTEQGTDTTARLWLAVERPGRQAAYLDNMADRPITGTSWQPYEVVGEVAADASVIGIGLSVTGDGRVWIAAASIDDLGPAQAGEAAPRPLSDRGVANLVALARLLGYVRYFHPSDEAAAVDWGPFTAAAVARIEEIDPAPAPGANGTGAMAAGAAPSPSRRRAATPAPRGAGELAAALTRLFAPLAPTLRVFPTGSRPPALDLGPPAGAAPESLHLVWWSHAGLGAAGHSPFFASIRVHGEAGRLVPGSQDAALHVRPEGDTTPGAPGQGAQAPAPLPASPMAPEAPDPRVPFTADLGGGVSCTLPLALYADAAGTLPHTAVPPAAAANLSPTDRYARLATVILAWNVVQHFHPGLPDGGHGWVAALAPALREAAAGSGAESLLATLRRMVAATRDGQATVAATGDAATFGLPLRWDWIDGRLVIERVAAEAGGIGGSGAEAPAKTTSATFTAAPAPGVTAGATAPGGPAGGAPLGAAGAEAIHPGAAVLRLGGQDVETLLRAAEAEAAAATPRLRRWRALARLGLGASGEPVDLTIEDAPAGTDGSSGSHRSTGSLGSAGSPRAAIASSNSLSSAAAGRHRVTLTHSLPPARLPAMTSLPDAIHEATPGVLVVDLSRLPDTALEAALPRLAQAAAIVFDLRGYVRSTDLLLAHLIAAPVATRREQIPHWSAPDRGAAAYTRAAVPIAPAQPQIKARLAFISSTRDTGLAESFLATAAALRLGPIVGAPTGGATGTVDSAPLPGGLTLLWTATLPAPGAPPPGTPVQPTVPAAPTRQGLAAGHDEVLEKALSLVAPGAHP